MSKRSSKEDVADLSGVDISGGKKVKFIEKEGKSSFVNLPRFDQVLERLCFFHQLSCPILIEGPIGSGKSFLIEQFYRSININNEDVAAPIVINMGEQNDAKTLFGAFITNPLRPGEFCWKAGVILEALSSGRWLVIEDVDLASPEMIATIKGLLESQGRNEYYVTQMGRSVPIHTSFRLIATRRSIACSSNTSGLSAATASTPFDRLGRDMWQTVYLSTFTEEEYESLIAGRFPQLIPITSTIIRLYNLVASTESSNALFKFCARISGLVRIDSANLTLEENLRNSLLLEAVDCFASSWSSRDKRKELAKDMSVVLSIPESHIDVLYETKPAIEVNSDRSRLSIGRVVFDAVDLALPRFKQLDSSSSASSIALTTLTCQTLEKLSVSVRMNEPVLLVGETGTGKTTTVQHLSSLLQFNSNLRVLNMSQQSEASDLLGGFKPFSAQSLARPLLEEFVTIFGRAFSMSKNTDYLTAIQESFAKQSWKRFIKLIKQAIELISTKSTVISSLVLDRLRHSLEGFEAQVTYAANNLLFSFVEGSLVEALTNGHWLLLDEINLASPETLNILAGLLRDSNASVTLTERGDTTPITRHPNFRLFACMNPATDVSKRDLPPAIRSRFTQIFVDETDVRRDDLRQVIDHLIGPGRDGTLKERLTSLYYRLKDLVGSFELVDGNGRKPLLNLRTLTRPIKFARSCEALYGLERSLYEGWCLSFTTMLDEESAKITRNILREFLMPTETSIRQLRPVPSAIPVFTSGKSHLLVEGYVLSVGPLYSATQESSQNNFVLTPSVQRNVAMLSRAVMSKKYPILLEGPTSAGKTSVIEYLSGLTGHHFVRINNHEHTDIQEYLGSYVSDPDTGRLQFKEGILVQALRKGHWLVLDELNLAPSDIMEALNRLLDDNRELFLPETGETVRPHPDFQLFATQNPAGAVYGGRKVLSRAFRSRFLELQFNDLPLEEVEQILSSRCNIAPSFARRIAQVYRILQERRSSSATNIFAGRHALITLRDCFRWAGRHSHSAIGSTQEFAEDGYFVLSERCRHADEAAFIRETLEKVCKTKIDPQDMYDIVSLCEKRGWTEDIDHLKNIQTLAKQLNITWTKPIRRLFALVYLCIRFGEPIILVGETGCGKTTVCQLVAQILARPLKIVNCHANSESGDFLGSFRPVRSEEGSQDAVEAEETVHKLFQWQDGPLVEAMKNGHLFLMDEISLADDSVLERLNSVLEPSKYLLLAECSETVDDDSNQSTRLISAHAQFAILATMNPGGDFGKKELSPALRNRFTEVWVPTIGDQDDLKLIISSRLELPLDHSIVQILSDFWYWWQETLSASAAGASLLSASKRAAASLRDLLGWLQFATSPALFESIASIELRLLHGAAMIFTDRLGSENAELRKTVLLHLADSLGNLIFEQTSQVLEPESHSIASLNQKSFSIGPFSFPVSSSSFDQIEQDPFAFEAPTTKTSALRVLRALQLGKAILLEGSPGVGKTTLIGALASATGNRLTRINLSEQTDLVDLFGSDLPVDGGIAGRFRWADGPFLQALKRGDWILLDELNLASQSVLEGLNACLDHRGQVFIPELGKEFECSPNTRIFAAQNPAGQGGGRKGLPKSFLNRFTIVWFDSLCKLDYQVILSSQSNMLISSDDITKMIDFNELLNKSVVIENRFGASGRPWEFNLRDLSRWIKLIQKTKPQEFFSPVQFIRPLYASRFRTEEDKNKVGSVIESVFGAELVKNYYQQLPNYDVILSEDPNNKVFCFDNYRFNLNADDEKLIIIREQIEAFEAALIALKMGWLCILTGPASSGKSILIDTLARLHSSSLKSFFISPDTDTLELLGSFEQVDYQRRWNFILEEISSKFTTLNLIPFNKFESANIPELLALISSKGVECAHLNSKIENLVSTAQAQSAEGRFEWVDGPLVRAMTLGHWLVLENVNLASSAVLDRLNSLFEPNGNLVLSEQGCTISEGIRVIRPAPGFRLFMTVDPKFGEISRAMRNRGIEIACVTKTSTKVLDDLQIVKQELGNNSERAVELLKRLLPLRLNRKILKRVAQAANIRPDLSVDDIVKVMCPQDAILVEDLSQVDLYWMNLCSKLPLLISSQVTNIPLSIQTAMLPLSGENGRFEFSFDNLALLTSFMTHWNSQQTANLRTSILSELLSIPVEDCSGSNHVLLIQFVKQFLSLSSQDLEFIQSIDMENTSIFGFLIWLLCHKTWTSFSPHRPALTRLSSQSSLTSSTSHWEQFYRHFGFKLEEVVQIYMKLVEVSCSPSIIRMNETVQKEVVDALELLISNQSVKPEIIEQLKRFSDVVISKVQNSSNTSSTSSFVQTFLSTPLTLLYLHKRVKSLTSIPRSVPISSASYSQEWLSQVWSLTTNCRPVDFFSGFDGLGGLLETANWTWKTRSIQEEAELMSVFETVLKFVVSHGGRDRRTERLFLLKGLFNSSSQDEITFANELLDSGCSFLQSVNMFEFDPVVDHYQAIQRSISTTLHFYSAQDHWENLFQIAYKGQYIAIDRTDQVVKLSAEMETVKEYILLRPSDEIHAHLMTELRQLTSNHLHPLLHQVASIRNNLSAVNIAQIEMVQSSLLKVRVELLSQKFVLFRDLTAPVVEAIDRIKIGLYILQTNTFKNSIQTSELLPISFSTDSSKWTCAVNSENNTSSDLTLDTLTLRLASYVPESDPIMSSIICPMLSVVLDKIHDEIRAEEARNTKDDSLFVFKGSNNDDDALDTEFANELFGDFESHQRKHENFNEDDFEDNTDDVEMKSSRCSAPQQKRLNFSTLSVDLMNICSAITTSSSDSLSPGNMKEILNWSYNFISDSIALTDCADPQVYRMLVWTLSDKLAKRHETSSSIKKEKKSRSKKQQQQQHYNFYRDPCPEGRLRDALEILTLLQDQIQKLLLEWPEHDVLQSLERQIVRFFDLPVSTTPMMEALLALERLYLRSQDWEKYSASKNTSLGENIQKLLELIVSWRRFEVENWRGLLDAVVVKMEYDSIGRNGEWLTLARVALSKMEFSDVSHIASLIELIDSFILAAPVGQFSKRLEILQFCTQLAHMNSKNISDSTVASAFKSSLLYYQTTLAHRVRDYSKMCREPVDRDLSAFLMTLCWKDVNYWAVRSTAEKSHRHLARMVRKWKEAMQMPLSALLNQMVIKPQLLLSSIDSVLVNSSKKPSSKSSTTPSTRLVVPCTSIGLKVKTRLDSIDLSSLSSEIVDSFGNVIISTLNELKQSTEKSIQPKQKAFVDLIRELKVFGIRINRAPSPNMLASKNILSLYAQFTNSTASIDDSSEFYIIKTLEKWQRLACAVSHDDITFRQAEIIKNSMSFLIEMLVCGSKRSYRDASAIKFDFIRKASESLSYRQSLVGSVGVNQESLGIFTDFLWKAQVQTTQLTTLFEAHPGVKPVVLAEIFNLTRSTLLEISSLIRGIKVAPTGYSCHLSKVTLDRITNLLSAVIDSVNKFDFDTEFSRQVFDLTSQLGPILQTLLNTWTSIQIQEDSSVDSNSSDLCIKRILLFVQQLESEVIIPAPESLDEFSLYPDYLRKQSESVALILDRGFEVLKPALHLELSHSSCPVELSEIVRICSVRFIGWFESLVQSHYRSCARLTLILSNVFLHLFQEGFCRPVEDEADKERDESKDGKLSEGMGIGEGEGDKNMSKEIEFEEQVTGTLNEKEEESEDKKDKKDDKEDKDKEEDKIDMSQDFDGELQDLMEEEDDKDKENGDKEGEDKDNEDNEEDIPDDQMNEGNEEGKEDIQDLDPSWWNSEDEEDKEEIERDTEEDQQDKIPSSKDKNQKKEKDNAAKEDKKDKNLEESIESAESESEADAESGKDEDESEDTAAADNNKKDAEKEDQEADEDVDMDRDEVEAENDEDLKDQTSETEQEETIKEEDQDIEPAESEADNNELKEQNELDPEQDLDSEQAEQDEDDTIPIDPPQQEDLSEEYQNEPERSSESENEEMKSESESESEEDPSDTNNNNNNNAHSDNVQDNSVQDNNQDDNSKATSTSQSNEDSTKNSENQVRTFDTKSQNNNSNSSTDPHQQDNQENRIEPIKEQVEKWKRSIHRIMKNESLTDEQQPEQEKDKDIADNLDKLTKEQQYEHAKEDSENSLNVKAETEEALQIEGKDDTSPTNSAALETETKSETSEDENEKDKDDVEGSKKKEDTLEQQEKLKLVPQLTTTKSQTSSNLPEVDPEIVEHFRKLSLLPTWSEYEFNTSDLAFDLCEQLRLVLAPTQATKLRGDYRTGKRLNLRKILPYIASQYRRDKIWLRRTKSSQRNYRVCLSIDNSKSMMETGSVSLAFAAIATISQALERLEVGELALIGFGEESHVLQPFTSGVAKVSVGDQLRASHLTFDELSTDVPALLETVLDTFEQAPPSSNTGPTWQLNIILSDGICHHHERIKPLLSRCQSARILNIFVLLDNRPEESSIFQLSHVEYVDQGIDPMTGQVKTGIKMTKYLETFPFEFYVVLRDVQMLPSVLADALKQWFELIALQEGES